MFRSIPLSLKETWKNAHNPAIKRPILVGGAILIIVVLYILPIFFNHIEKRKGIVLNDWLLAHIPSHNVSVLIFLIIWGMGLLAFCRAIYNPTVCITYIWTLIFICIARIITINLFALNPPAGLIPLADPLTGVFYGHANITKDLFFSGHTSTLTLIFLCLEKKRDKQLALAALFMVMILLLIQHIHYTIDIVAAPVIVYALFRLANSLLNSYQH